MKLYILRHGDAADRGDRRYVSDAERPLTPKGVKRTRQLVNTLRKLGITFSVILTSPLLRARQTAEIVARGLELEKHLRLTNHLSPSGAHADLVAQIENARSHARAILLVGHEPHLSGLISLLCTGGSSLSLMLKKGGLCRLELESARPGRCATLEWLLSPRHFGSKRRKGKKQ